MGKSFCSICKKYGHLTSAHKKDNQYGFHPGITSDLLRGGFTKQW